MKQTPYNPILEQDMALFQMLKKQVSKNFFNSVRSLEERVNTALPNRTLIERRLAHWVDPSVSIINIPIWGIL